MPPTKKKKSRTFFDKEKYTAELSSGQLVIGVCILMLFGLTCFLLGLLTSRFQPLPPGVGMATATSSSADAATNPVQQPNRSNPAAVNGRPRTSAPTRTRVPAPEPEERTRQPVAQTPDEPKTENSSTPLNKSIPVAETSDPEEGLLEKTQTAMRSEPEKPESSAAPKEASALAKPTNEVFGDYFVVQIGAFTDKTSARTLMRQLESKTEYTAEIIDSPSGRLVIVLVGRFSNKADAEKARVYLKEKLGFKDCFVKKKTV